MRQFAAGFKKWMVIAAGLAMLLVVLLVSQFLIFEKDEGYQATAFAMGSYVQQTLYGTDAEEVSSDAAHAVTELEQLISWRVDGSDIAALNQTAGEEAVQLDARTMDVLNQALSVAQATNGAYDPTVLPVSSLWNFDTDEPTLPDQTDISDALNDVGYGFLTMNEAAQTASLAHQGNGVDLGGIGKGAACDAAVEVYRASDVDAAIVAVGGSIGLYGSKPDDSDWLVAVRDPNGTQNDSLGVLALQDGFVSTSGSYEKTFTVDGQTYHHLLDPNTGYPAQSDLVSVTVVCENGALSDALATACFVLGLEDSLPVLRAFDAEALFIDQENRITIAGDVSFELRSSSYTVSRQEL